MPFGDDQNLGEDRDTRERSVFTKRLSLPGSSPRAYWKRNVRRHQSVQGPDSKKKTLKFFTEGSDHFYRGIWVQRGC